MDLKHLFSLGKAEQAVLAMIGQHVALLCAACEAFCAALDQDKRQLLAGITDLEREGDVIRREIFTAIYDGAFLPLLRPSICNFVETVDKALDLTEDVALELQDLPAGRVADFGCVDYVVQVAHLNQHMAEMLAITLAALCKGENLREKNLAIRIYEKQIDDIKDDLVRKLRETEVRDFWEGKLLADFIAHLTSISDFIEDASDYLQIMNLSLR
ncbi:MAG: TIGR00153 family protein [Deltaproteobacteria bacterium RIFOXYD12_FULL_57_12]|nr:MAG: TIGR00153 family protein [Deltaproteobacteria bacterium RIFOXYD12_FULL_57_12]